MKEGNIEWTPPDGKCKRRTGAAPTPNETKEKVEQYAPLEDSTEENQPSENTEQSTDEE